MPASDPAPSSRPGFFGFALHYAFRSLGRNPRRTLLTVTTVALSAVVTIVASRYSTALMSLWREGATNTGLAHAQIHTQGYLRQPDGLSLAQTIVGGGPLERSLAGDPFVTALSPRLKFEGIISAKDKTVYFLGIGVDPKRELEVSPSLFNPGNPEGHDQGTFLSGTEKEAATIGMGLAETLNLHLGDEATLVTQTVTGAVNGIDIVIRGIVDVPLPSFSRRLVYVNLEHARRLLRLPNRYTELAVRVTDPAELPAWIDAHSQAAAAEKLELAGWWQIDPVIPKVERIWHSAVGLISTLLFLSAALSVLNIIFMTVAERTVEIGTLMAIGARARDIRRLFALEAALIGLVGGCLGVLGGNAVVLAMNLVGMPIASPFSSGTYVVRPTMSLMINIAVLVGAVVVCMLASIPPSRKASSVDPTQAFRGQIT